MLFGYICYSCEFTFSGMVLLFCKYDMVCSLTDRVSGLITDNGQSQSFNTKIKFANWKIKRIIVDTAFKRSVNMERYLTNRILEDFEHYLFVEEKSSATIDKYMRDVTALSKYAGDREITKELVISFKQKLIKDGYAVRSINSMISSVNSLFNYLQWYDCRVKNLKFQQEVFCPEEKELTKDEYVRLVRTAGERGNERLCMLMQTICATGIRVSELNYITVENVKKGQAKVRCKGKTRTIMIVKKLQKRLLKYARERKIKSGAVFVTNNGNPMSRTNIWKEMKELCKKAGVSSTKVFPHNLRHLFARIFYSLEKDIAQLADVLGHSNINTTRIYIVSTGTEHMRQLENMHLII